MWNRRPNGTQLPLVLATTLAITDSLSKTTYASFDPRVGRNNLVDCDCEEQNKHCTNRSIDHGNSHPLAPTALGIDCKHSDENQVQKKEWFQDI